MERSGHCTKKRLPIMQTVRENIPSTNVVKYGFKNAETYYYDFLSYISYGFLEARIIITVFVFWNSQYRTYKLSTTLVPKIRVNCRCCETCPWTTESLENISITGSDISPLTERNWRGDRRSGRRKGHGEGKDKETWTIDMEVADKMSNNINLRTCAILSLQRGKEGYRYS